MNHHRTISRIGLGSLAALELYAGLARAKQRRDLFAAAQARSTATGRPLVVVGDPDAGAWTRYLGREYGCGSVCTDLNGCPGCPVAIPADITQPLHLPPNNVIALTQLFPNAGPTVDGVGPLVPPNSAVVYVSCVLEYVPDPMAGWNEILRMAGSPENIFMAEVQPWAFGTLTFYPGTRSVISRDGATIVAKPVSPVMGLIYGGVFGALAVGSVV